MTIFRPFFRRAGRPGPLRVENGGAFSAILERYGITDREAEIIRLLLEGKDNKAIKESLFISDHTVKNHIHHIYQKLEIGNRIQLVQCFKAALGETGDSPAAVTRAARLWSGLPAAVSFAVVAAAVLMMWKPWPGSRRASLPKPVLAVLDFESLSPDAELDKWVTGFPLLLTTDLVQSKHIRTLGDDAVYGAAKKLGLAGLKRYTRDDLSRLARELGADYLLTGTLMKAGNRILVTAVLQDARTGEPLKTEKADCADEEELMRRADLVALAVKSGLRFTRAEIRDDIDSSVETLTTSSPLAYKYYAEGRRYHRTGDYGQALQMMEQAVALDPKFAMAYRAMSVASRNLRDFKGEGEFMKQAFELSGNLPENSRERAIIRGDYYSLAESTFGLAAEVFKRGLEDYPDDLLMNNSLAMQYYDLEEFEAAVKQAEIPIRQGTDDPFPYHTKAAALQALGRFSEAARLLRAYLENHPANRLVFQTLADILIQARDFGAAGEALDRADAVFPDPSWAFWRGVVLHETKGAAAASEEFRRLLLMEDAMWRVQAHQRLGSIALAGGRLADAAVEFRRGAELADSAGQVEWVTGLRRLLGQVLLDRGDVKGAVVEARKAVDAGRLARNDYRLTAAVVFLAEAHFRDGDAAAAEELGRQLAAMAATDGTRRIRRQLTVFQGLMELEKGRPREAVKRLEEAAAEILRKDGLDNRITVLYFLLARAREEAGDLTGATAALEAIVNAPGDRQGFAGYFAKAVLRLAAVEEKRGRAGPSLGHYRQFLALWKDGDPGRPEVRLAGERVTALSQAQGRLN